jgi:hypothetical protein
MAGDLAPAYLEHRTRLAQASAADDMLARVRAGRPAEGTPAAPATLPEGAMEPEAPEGSRVGRIAKDIGLGVVETPRGVVKGIRDAYQSTISMASELGGWLEEHNLGGGVIIDQSGVRFASGKELSEADVVRPGDYELPDIGAPKSVTGGIVKGVSQFLTGMKGANKLLDVAGVPAAAGALGYGRTAVQGAIANFAVFDAHQKRLSNLVQEFPALQNPVTEYLASDPTDNVAEGRFKNALEGVGLGLITDGFFKGVKLLREAGRARGMLDQAAAVPETVPAIDDAFRLLGDEPAAGAAKAAESGKAAGEAAEQAPLVGLKTVKEVDPKALGEAVEKPEVFINFARIDAPQDVKTAIQQMADLNAESTRAAQRGVQSFEQTKLNASQIDAWKVLQTRRMGEPFNAETALAARQLWATSGDRLTQLAQLASDSPSEANLFAFRKMLSVHHAIQQEVIAARTETARALSSWRIPAGAGKQRLVDIEGILAQNGGTNVSRELASRVAALGRAGMVKEMTEVVERTAYAKTRDAVLEGWINGLLSNPPTHIVNTMSNSLTIGLRMAERAVGGKIARLLGDENSVAAGEAAQQWFGMTQGLKDAFRYAYKSAKTGESGYGIGKLETAREGSITSEALGLSSSGWLGRSTDMLGSVVRIPGRALTAEDEFFKTLGYRMELNAQALRQATSEVNGGQLAATGIKQRIAELIQTPPENLKLAAIDAATYQTFTNTPGKLAQHIGQITSEYPLLKVILPFTKTPANILRFTFERTPLAPLMGQFRQNIAAGGARRDLALAQLAIGTTAMMTAADMTMSGQVSGSGPTDRGTKAAMQRQGWQPYSMKIGKRWYAYNRLDPVGSLFGMSADVVQTLQNVQHEAVDDADTEKLAVATAMAIAGNLVNKTYLSGLSSIFEAMADPQQYSEATIQRMVGSAVPAVAANVARQMDPYQRQVYSMLDQLKARTPGLSKDLPPRLNLWGEPLTYESGFGKAYDFFSPVYTKEGSNDPIDAELLRLESNIGMPRKRTSINGVTVDLTQYPAAYSRYVELAGNALKHPAWGLGAKDLLNQIVSGEHPLSAVYRIRSDGPDGGKDVYIKDLLRDYQDMARQQLLTEFPEIADQVGVKKERQREIRMPTIG